MLSFGKNSMKLLMSLLLIFCINHIVHSQSIENSETDKRNLKFLTNKSKVITAYHSSQYLGFAVGNHETVKAIDEIIFLLNNTVKSDLEFKYIFLEIPNDVNESLYKFSMGEFPLKRMSSHMDLFWYEKYQQSTQYKYVFKNLFTTVAEINKSRPNNPVILAAIDGVSKFKYTRDMYKIKNNLKYIYLGSIDREERTAENFLEVISGNEDKKGIIFYHYAHLLKNTTALGLDFNSKTYRNASLGWLDMLGQEQVGFLDKTHIILFDENDERYNPDGIIIDGQFTPNSYIRRYRGQSIETPDDITQCFDSIIRL